MLMSTFDISTTLILLHRYPSGLWRLSVRVSSAPLVEMIFILRNTIQYRHSHTHAYTHPYEHTRTPCPYEHLQNTEPAGQVLKLTKWLQAPRYRRERRLLLGFELWWSENHPPNHPTKDWFSSLRWPIMPIGANIRIMPKFISMWKDRKIYLSPLPPMFLGSDHNTVVNEIMPKFVFTWRLFSLTLSCV